MKEQISPITQGVERSRCDTAILSAFGCGAFGHPPEQVAVLFRTALHRQWSSLRAVQFFIIDDHNTGGPHNPAGNFLPIASILEQQADSAPGSGAVAAIEVAPFGAPESPRPAASPTSAADGPSGPHPADPQAAAEVGWRRLWEPYRGHHWYWHAGTSTATLAHPSQLGCVCRGAPRPSP